MQELDRYIDKIKKLPPAPKIIPELLHLLRQSDIDAGKIVRLITVDIGLTSSVLALANAFSWQRGTGLVSQPRCPVPVPSSEDPAGRQ